jgi:hypothetical protein
MNHPSKALKKDSNFNARHDRTVVLNQKSQPGVFAADS